VIAEVEAQDKMHHIEKRVAGITDDACIERAGWQNGRTAAKRNGELQLREQNAKLSVVARARSAL